MEVGKRAGADVGSGDEVIVFNDCAKLLDGFAMQGVFADHHFEAVVLAGIVTAGDLDGAVEFLGIGGKRNQRSGNHAEVYDMSAGSEHAALQAFKDSVARFSGIPADTNSGRYAACACGHRRECTTNLCSNVVGQIRIGDASDVISAKNIGIHRMLHT